MQYAPNTTAEYIEDALGTMNTFKELSRMIERCHQILRRRFDQYRYNYYHIFGAQRHIDSAFIIRGGHSNDSHMFQ